MASKGNRRHGCGPDGGNGLPKDAQRPLDSPSVDSAQAGAAAGQRLGLRLILNTPLIEIDAARAEVAAADAARRHRPGRENERRLLRLLEARLALDLQQVEAVRHEDRGICNDALRPPKQAGIKGAP